MKFISAIVEINLVNPKLSCLLFAGCFLKHMK